MSSFVLITGAAGFLGRSIVKQLDVAGWRVLAVDSVSKEDAAMPASVIYRQLFLPDLELGRLVVKFQPNACVHCAGRASVADSIRDPQADFESGVALTAALLEVLRNKARDCRTIFLSSAAVYGQPECLPVDESVPCRPMSPYGYHKRICEILMEQASRLQGIPTASARIFSAYGPGLRRQVLWETAVQFAKNNNATLKGTGTESRDFIYVEDVARAIRIILDKAPCEGEVYNVASGEETSICDAVNILGGNFPNAQPAIFEGGKISGDPERWVADCSRIKNLGFTSEVTIKQGLTLLSEWVKNDI
jgi:UDP-glucose 4-epimerase